MTLVLANLSVRSKLTFAFGCVLALMFILGGLAWIQMSNIYDQTDKILVYRVAGVRDSGRMASAATRVRTREYRVAVSKPDAVAAASERYKDSIQVFDKARKDYGAFLLNAEEKALFETANKAWDAYLAEADRAVQLAKAGQHDEAVNAVLGTSKTFDGVQEAIGALVKFNDDGAKNDAAVAKEQFSKSGMFLAATLAVAAAVAAFLGLKIANAITLPLNRAVTLAEAVAAGDLSRDVDSAGRDEIAKLTEALGTMVQKLRSIVSEVRNGVESVSTASTEIAVGNADLSQRTEEQAANLQQTAASMEQLTSTVRQNADNARAAAQLSATAREVAQRGGAVVGNVVSTMEAITESSKRISDIIGVIDGIAFQTNILALNAAVEAARAGEQGRGFAVVASEVRTLAQRSAQAAKEIKALIVQSVEKVDAGSALVDEAGKTMTDIVNQVQRVNDLVGEISSASHEQTQGIEQVGTAVSQLDQVTQQNAALVEESAAAAESMKHQAQKLAETVAVFNVGNFATTGSSAVRRSTPKPLVRPAPVQAKTVVKPAMDRSLRRPTAAAPAVGQQAAAAEAEGDWTSF